MKSTKVSTIRIGHSPDPDDAFMFYALAHEKIDMRGFKVEHVIEDIESLNQRALGNLNQEGGGRRAEGVKAKTPSTIHHPSSSFLEVTAVSCHAYAYLADKYAVIRSGASVGDRYGPILVRNAGLGTRESFLDFSNKKIAVPGKLTTAYLVLQLFLTDALKKTSPEERAPSFIFVPFDKIMDAVRSGEVDYGLVIHEGQLTHAEHGLQKVLDLGEWWHEQYKLPLPLGVDIIRKDLGPETMRSFAALFKESIQYALNHRKDALEYASQFGRGIADDLNDRFVAMYVNERTLDIGADGEAGFRKLLALAHQHKIIPKKVDLEFI